MDTLGRRRPHAVFGAVGIAVPGEALGETIEQADAGVHFPLRLYY